MKLKKDEYDINGFIDTEHDLITGKKILKTKKDRIEWQANKFSSAILMPRMTIRNAVIQIQNKEMAAAYKKYFNLLWKLAKK